MSQARADQILEVAEKAIRKGGIDAASFRDIAAAIGIKSASVHYHFPTKADLIQAVAVRYAGRFLDELGPASDPAEGPRERLGRLSDGYLAAYRQDHSTCLCALLGAVSSQLSEGTARQIREFYRCLGAWIEVALADAEPGMPAALMISLLQGAMILSIASGADGPLVEAKRYLLNAVP